MAEELNTDQESPAHTAPDDGPGADPDTTDVAAGAVAEDAGAEDVGAEDAGAEDVGAEDAGAEDAGAEDAGADDEEAEDEEAAGDTSQPSAPDAPPAESHASRFDLGGELQQLAELATRHPEIGPAVAEIAFKTGFGDIGERIVAMGLQQEQPSIEYYFAAAKLARRERRHDDALNTVVRGLLSVTESAEPMGAQATSLLHLIRLGFAVLLFEIRDVEAGAPEFRAAVQQGLPKLKAQFETDAFFFTLLAQAEWLSDRSQSEATWDHAATLGDAETTWNARGTWYKEAERDLEKAETAYRRGLEAAPHSALLMHNLAQVLLDRIRQSDAATAQATRWIHEAERVLKRALREGHRARLRRHIYATVDRMKRLRSAMRLETERREPAVGDVVWGRVKTLTHYGAFLGIPGHSGLLHKSELAYEFIEDPAARLRVGDELEVKIIEVKPREDGPGLRIGFSRKAVLPKPAPASEGDSRSRRRPDDRRQENRKQNRDERRPPRRRDNDNDAKAKPQGRPRGLATFGDILRAKQAAKDSDD